LNTFYNYLQFWRLRPHHCVCHLHHCLANSRTCQDLALRFPGLSRSWKFNKHNSRTFQDLALRFSGLSRIKLISEDFPGPGNFTNNSGTFQDLALRFPGLSMTKLIFQDFADPGNFSNTIPGLFRRHKNPGYQ